MLGYQKSAIAGRTPRKQSVVIFELVKAGRGFQAPGLWLGGGVEFKARSQRRYSGLSQQPKVNGVRPAADFWYPSMRQPAAPH